MTKAPAIYCALDRPDLAGALALARSLAGVVDGFKVGLEFVTANGPDGVRRVVQLGLPVFLDLKFHDIPNTVAGGIEAARALDVRHADPARSRRACDAARAVGPPAPAAAPATRSGVTVPNEPRPRRSAALGLAEKVLGARGALLGWPGTMASTASSLLHEVALLRQPFGAEIFTLVVAASDPPAARCGHQRMHAPADARRLAPRPGDRRPDHRGRDPRAPARQSGAEIAAARRPSHGARGQDPRSSDAAALGAAVEGGAVAGFVSILLRRARLSPTRRAICSASAVGSEPRSGRSSTRTMPCSTGAARLRRRPGSPTAWKSPESVRRSRRAPAAPATKALQVAEAGDLAAVASYAADDMPPLHARLLKDLAKPAGGNGWPSTLAGCSKTCGLGCRWPLSGLGLFGRQSRRQRSRCWLWLMCRWASKVCRAQGTWRRSRAPRAWPMAAEILRCATYRNRPEFSS